MFFLIPLAISLVSAGVGIVSQVQQNNELSAESATSLAGQEEKNQFDLISQSIAYSQAIDANQEQRALLEKQARINQAATNQRVTTALLATAVFMLVLTVVALINRK